MKFRKRPVVIDAWEIALDAERPAWVQEAFAADVLDWDPAGEGLWINTPAGAMVGSMGDMLIRGVKGELYPCDPEIFAATYEPIDGE